MRGAAKSVPAEIKVLEAGELGQLGTEGRLSFCRNTIKSDFPMQSAKRSDVGKFRPQCLCKSGILDVG